MEYKDALEYLEIMRKFFTDDDAEGEVLKQIYDVAVKTVKKQMQIEDLFNSYDLNRLKELAEADKEGRCLVLPCKVGELPDEDIAIPEIQILKKPAKCKVGYCQRNSAGYSYVLETKYHCPTCGVVVSEYTDFCPRCRQLLEWNKEEEE